MNVSVKTSRKIGLLTSIAIMIGSIIGIGIFFKNGSVFTANGNDGISVLIAWIISAVVSTATAFSFGEASSSIQSGGGIGDWANKLCGKKIGYFTKFNLPFFYFGILIISVGVFTAEAILNIFGLANNVHMGFIMLMALGILALIVLFNIFSTRGSQITQVVLSSLKFIPIILIIVLGFAFFQKAENNNLFVNDNPDKKINSNGFAGILASIPAILFAFDSFTCVGSLGNEVKTKKTIPLAIIIGMLLVSIIYIMITVVQILIGQGTIGGSFEKIFHDNETAKIVFSYIVSIFIFLSILGVANALTITCLRTYDTLVFEKIIFGHQFISKISKNKPLVSGTIVFMFIGGLWWVILTILSSIFNHDAFVDGLSNYSTLFFFAIYGIVVFGTLLNRFTKKVQVYKLNSYLFYPMAIISLIGILTVFGYQFFYENIAKLFIDTNSTISWGVLHGPLKDEAQKIDESLKVWQGAITFFVMVIVFMVAPSINFYLNKSITNKFEKNIQDSR